MGRFSKFVHSFYPNIYPEIPKKEVSNSIRRVFIS
jgi:hypothetical protein